MRVIRKKIVLPFLVFVVGMVILGATVYRIQQKEREQNRTAASLNAMTYAERMKTDIMAGIGITDTLKQILVSEEGKIRRFSLVAKDMMTDSIQSIQIAPEGVVTEIYPEEGNEAGKIDLINDEDRGAISRYARDRHTMVMQGPFELKQGGYGIAVRNPVYLQNKNEQEYFWGFTIVIIRVPDIFADSLKALSDFGYDYRVFKTVSPWDSDYEEVYGSVEEMEDPVSYSFNIKRSQWKLEVMPKDGWAGSWTVYGILPGGLLIVLLLTVLTSALLILNENQRKFKKLAVTDGLTGIYNRHGFDEQVIQYLKQHPKEKCVGMQFDIDDFKLVNDMYGHASGDTALRTLAKSMQEFFGKNAVLGRCGGDEFSIFLPACTCDEAKEKIEQFVKMPRTIHYSGEDRKFGISLGYAEYPRDGGNYSELQRCADAALYEVKLRGKNGCLEYSKDLRLEIRKQLGFALKDVSENLPGAFIIYKADKTNDEILFANREMIQMTGCESMDELLAYTGHSFRNLIQEDEREKVEQCIWQQIGDGHSNDYVRFHLRKQDGTHMKVLDHGRFVENGRYGKVFYVLIMDWKSIQKHYRESF